MLCMDLSISVLFDENDDKLKLFFISVLAVYFITISKWLFKIKHLIENQ